MTEEEREAALARGGLILFTLFLKLATLGFVMWVGSALIINVAEVGFTWGNTPWLILMAWLFKRSL